MVLRRYAALPESELRAIFPDDSAGGRARSPRITLALEAIRVGRPGYAPFGLDLLRTCLREEPQSFSAADYFRLVGEADPFSAEFFAREHQLLKRSRFLRVARRFSRWCRSLNFRG